MPYANEADKAAWQRAYCDRRKALVEAAKAKPCADCGHSYPTHVMDLDHVDGEKIATINRMRWSWGPEALAREIAKCEAVCANCHRERTQQRLLQSAAPA